MAEQKPSVGRIVLVSGKESNGVTEHPAIINRVWSDDKVNVMVFPDNGMPYPKTSVRQSTDGSAQAEAWRWPPRV